MANTIGIFKNPYATYKTEAPKIVFKTEAAAYKSHSITGVYPGWQKGYKSNMLAPDKMSRWTS